MTTFAVTKNISCEYQLNSPTAERLSIEERTLLEHAASVPRVPYSYEGFSSPPTEDRKESGYDFTPQDFPPEAKVKDLMDDQGNVLLFRYINGPYVQGFTDNGKRSIERQGNAYSYSLSPTISITWNSYRNGTPVILIAVQNIDKDQLLTWGNERRFNKLAGREMRTLAPLNKNKVLHEFGFIDIKVPVSRENVIAIIEASEMIELLEQFGKHPFSMKALMQKVINSRTVESAASYKKHGLKARPPSVGSFYDVVPN